jgi:ABC-type enterochelin transport system substrate-binding protein
MSLLMISIIWVSKFFRGILENIFLILSVAYKNTQIQLATPTKYLVSHCAFIKLAELLKNLDYAH